MADVTIYKQHLESKSLPQVCVVTGQPATRWVRVSYSNRPVWIYLLLVAGLLVAAIVDALVTKYVRAKLPIAANVARRYTALGLSAVVLMLGGVVAIIAAAVSSSGVLAVLGVSGFIAAIVALAVRPRGLPKGKVEPNGQFVDLLGVHPRFVEALAATAPEGYAAPAFAGAAPWAGAPAGVGPPPETPWEPSGGWGGPVG